jgi:hypothetical protein
MEPGRVNAFAVAPRLERIAAKTMDEDHVCLPVGLLATGDWV